MASVLLTVNTPQAPLDLEPPAEHRRRIALTVEQIRIGKIENIGEVTLDANQATTVLNDSRISVQSFIGLMSLTANAATEIATLFFSAQTTGSATITHTNNAQTDRTFRYTIIG